MAPVTCYAHACTVAEVEMDDETGEVEVVSLKAACEVGRAMNPRLVAQRLGGGWMGMSHALWETTAPCYPDRSHGPTDFNEYLMPGPGDVCEQRFAILERPAPDGPYGGNIGKYLSQSAGLYLRYRSRIDVLEYVLSLDIPYRSA